MAARVLPNTVFVEGFPGQVSKYALLSRFGGPKYHIEDIWFTNVQGEPKKAFIRYTYAYSVQHALSFNGASFYPFSADKLAVTEVNEENLCNYIHEVATDAEEASDMLQEMLRSVLKSRNETRRDLDALREDFRDFRERHSSLKAERDALKQELKETSEEKAHALERLQAADKMIQAKKNEDTSGSCLRSDSKTGILGHITDDRKRQRDEDVPPSGQPPAQRRRTFRDQAVQARAVLTCAASVQVDSRLEHESTINLDIKDDALETLLEESRAKLGHKAIVIESLLAAFLRMDAFTRRILDQVNRDSDTPGPMQTGAHDENNIVNS